MSITKLKSTLFAFANPLVATFLIWGCMSHVSFWYDTYQTSQITSPSFLLSILILSAIYFFAFYKKLLGFLKTPYIYWCTAVLVIYILNYIRLQKIDVSADEISAGRDAIVYFLLAPAIANLVYHIPIRYFRFAVGTLAILAPLVLIFDFSNPGLMHPNAHLSTVATSETNIDTSARVSGFWLNPNFAAEAVVLLLALAGTMFSKQAMTILFFLASLGLVLTASRSGVAAMFVLAIIYLLQNRISKWILFVPLILAFSASTLFIIYEETALNLGREGGLEDAQKRLSVFFGDAVEDHSSEARTVVAQEALKHSLVKPIFGHGYRYVDPVLDVGPHNMLADLAYQLGLSGVLIWIWLGYILYKSHPGLLNTGLLLFLWYSMFSHNMLETNVWFMFLALMIMRSPRREMLTSAEVPHSRKSARRRKATGTDQLAPFKSSKHRRRKRKKKSIRF